jgi:hypothetical protein
VRIALTRLLAEGSLSEGANGRTEAVDFGDPPPETIWQVVFFVFGCFVNRKKLHLRPESGVKIQ